VSTMKVIIERDGVEESYVLYDSGLLIVADESFETVSGPELGVLRPSAPLFHRLVIVNSKVRTILGLNPDQIKKI